MQDIRYPYRKYTSILYSVCLAALIAVTIPRILYFINIYDSTDWQLILLFDFGFLMILSYLVVKRLIPALKNETALEINCSGIISATKNAKICWVDIEDVQLGTTGRTSTYFLQIKYKKNVKIKLLKFNYCGFWATIKKYTITFWSIGKVLRQLKRQHLNIDKT